MEQVRERQPVYLREKDGTLVPVFGYTPEDFDELIDLKNQIGRGQIRPRYTLQRLAAVRHGHAASSPGWKWSCDVLVSDTGWVRVPLRMPEAVLVPTPKYKGPTRYFTGVRRRDGRLLPPGSSAVASSRTRSRSTLLVPVEQTLRASIG